MIVKFLLFVLTLMAAALLYSGLWSIGTAVVEAYQCDRYSRLTQKRTEYSGFECYVQDHGQWYLFSEYKNRIILQEDQ